MARGQNDPSDPPEETTTEPVTETEVRDWLATQFEGTNSRYGFDVTAKFDGSVS